MECQTRYRWSRNEYSVIFSEIVLCRSSRCSVHGHDWADTVFKRSTKWSVHRGKRGETITTDGAAIGPFARAFFRIKAHSSAGHGERGRISKTNTLKSSKPTPRRRREPWSCVYFSLRDRKKIIDDHVSNLRTREYVARTKIRTQTKHAALSSRNSTSFDFSELWPHWRQSHNVCAIQPSCNIFV